MSRRPEHRVYSWPHGVVGVVSYVGKSDDGRWTIARRPGASPFLVRTEDWLASPLVAAPIDQTRDDVAALAKRFQETKA